MNDSWNGRVPPASEAWSEDLISRFFFVLPEPLSFDSDHLFVAYVPGSHGSLADDDPLVVVRFHHSRQRGRIAGALNALNAAIPDSRSHIPSAPPLELESAFTVIEAFTATRSPDDPPGDWTGDPRDLSPRADDFMRCLRAVDDWARAYRITLRSPYGRITYERVLPMVLVYRANAPMPLPLDVGTLDSLEWHGPSALQLGHLNADPVGGPLASKYAAEVIHWREGIERADPFVTWRERLTDSRQALNTDGDLGRAALLGYTASEVLLDSILSLILWEEGADPTEAAQTLESEPAPKRCETQLQPRLKGNWKRGQPGPVREWLQHAGRLRGRVVHGGYEPTRPEVLRALQTVDALERHVFDRLAARCNTYPRSALMTVAEPGLRKRNLWHGRIKSFAEGVAQTEPNWRDAFSEWRKRVVALRLQQLES